MCGFVGIVTCTEQNRDESAEFLRRATSALRHRGPDATTFWQSPHAAIGFNRLAINALNNGTQPLTEGNNSLVTVCNGEIYNHQSLRRLLTTRGYQLTNDSDVAVIPAAFREFGADFLDYLNGMFALALWDESRRELILARDHAGIKPLYFAETRDGLIFASEPRAILEHPHHSRSLDLMSMGQYLAFDYVPLNRSIYRGIQKLPAACALVWRNGAYTIRRHWKPAFPLSESQPPLSLAERGTAFLETLRSVVSLETAADVPVGVFLSGGIDSSAIAAIAAEQSSSPIRTFSVRFEDPSVDESQFSRLVSKNIRSVHHELCVTEEMCRQVAGQLGTMLDEPLADSSFIPTFLISKHASQSVRVVLGGDGGDELFAGYPTYQAHRLVQLYESLVPFAIRAHLAPAILARIPVPSGHMNWNFKLRRLLDGRGVPFCIRHQRWMGTFNPELQQELVSPELLAAMTNPYAPISRILEQTQAHQLFNQALDCDMQLYLEGDILTKLDRATMLNSIEGRVPLLNRSIVDFATALPFDFKLRHFTTKYFLKKTLRGVVPSTVIKRRKQGFNFAVARYLRTSLRDLMLDLLSESTLRRQGLFSPEYVTRLVKEHLSGLQDHRKQLWNLICFQSWYRSWM